MYELTIVSKEGWDPTTESFVYPGWKTATILLEHSLLSVSKWESKWHKSFFDRRHQMDYPEFLSYIQCMTVSKNVNPDVYNYITPKQITDITNYMQDPMTATTIKKNNRGPNGTFMTNEVIYGMMCNLQIPFECEKWHLNRLMTLINVVGEQNAPKKKMTPAEIGRQNAALNAQRRARHHSKG